MFIYDSVVVVAHLMMIIICKHGQMTTDEPKRASFKSIINVVVVCGGGGGLEWRTVNVSLVINYKKISSRLPVKLTNNFYDKKFRQKFSYMSFVFIYITLNHLPVFGPRLKRSTMRQDMNIVSVWVILYSLYYYYYLFLLLFTKSLSIQN